MLKKWFTLPTLDEAAPQPKPLLATPAKPSASSEETSAAPRAPTAVVTNSQNSLPKYGPFEQIYQTAAVKPPRLSYGILKVAEMVNSAHLSGMSPEARRCSLLMALEAAGAEIEDLLQDAVVRQRALNDYEEGQSTRLQSFQQNKLDENKKIQQELDRLTGQYLARIQANLDEVAREQDNFHVWQRTKQQEAQRITEAAAYCVPQGNSASMSSLTAVLERATAVNK
jgi:hypothetical protein